MDRIYLSDPAKTRLADLMAKHEAALEAVGAFVTTCGLVMNVDGGAYMFDLDLAAFVKLLPDDVELDEKDFLPIVIDEGTHGEYVCRLRDTVRP